MPDPTTFREALEALTTTRQKQFVQFYLGLICSRDGEYTTFNALRSALAAGYSARSAHATGAEVLKNPGIKLAISFGLGWLAMKSDEVVARLGDQARASLEDFTSVEIIEQKEALFITVAKRRADLVLLIADAEAQERAMVGSKADANAWAEVAMGYKAELAGLPEHPDQQVLVLGRKANAMQVRIDLIKAQRLGKMHLIKKLKQTDSGSLEIELHNAQTALESIGKMHGLYTDRVQHSGEVTTKHWVFGPANPFNAQEVDDDTV
jgi:hypothetical protein